MQELRVPGTDVSTISARTKRGPRVRGCLSFLVKLGVFTIFAPSKCWAINASKCQWVIQAALYPADQREVVQ